MLKCRIPIRLKIQYTKNMKPVAKKQQMQKVTIMLPRDLVERATRVSGLGLTPAIREGLEAVAATHAYERLRQLRGKVKFSINLKELRRD
jgi:hypothetical protein